MPTIKPTFKSFSSTLHPIHLLKFKYSICGCFNYSNDKKAFRWNSLRQRETFPPSRAGKWSGGRFFTRLKINHVNLNNFKELSHIHSPMNPKYRLWMDLTRVFYEILETQKQQMTFIDIRVRSHSRFSVYFQFLSLATRTSERQKHEIQIKSFQIFSLTTAQQVFVCEHS